MTADSIKQILHIYVLVLMSKGYNYDFVSNIKVFFDEMDLKSNQQIYRKTFIFRNTLSNKMEKSLKKLLIIK